MHGKVNYYVGGEFQSKDLRDAQRFKADGVAAVAADGIGTGHYYAGLGVTQGGVTSLLVAPGRLLKDGQYYTLPQSSSLPGTAGAVLEVGAHLPIIQNKIVALCVWGRVIETQVENRSFRLDLVTDTTEFRAVPVIQHWEAVVDIVDDGTEAVAPVVPAIPPGMLHFCSIWLSPSGITRIEMVESVRLPSTIGLQHLLTGISQWRTRIEAQVDSLKVQFAALRAMQFNYARHRELINMASDVALLKRLALLPAGTSAYDADAFQDESGSDTSHPSYDARVDWGLLFSVAAQATINLALLSPNDANAKRSGDLLLPAYDSVPRFTSGTWNGQDVAMAIEQSSWEYETVEFSSWVNVKGWSFNHYAQWWCSQFAWWGQTDYRVNRISQDSYTARWLNDWNRNWTLAPVEAEVLTAGSQTQVSGAAIAQTFVAPTLWLTEVEVFITGQAQGADLQLFICPTSETGKPLFSAVLGKAIMPHESIQVHPKGTRLQLNHPVLLQGGERYAMVLVSDGIYRLATIESASFAEGTFFTSSSGDFFQGDQAIDLLFVLHGAKFRYPRTVLSLQPISLAGGITDLKLLLRQRVPQGCNLEVQYQVNGVWHQLKDGESPLDVAPSLVPLRAVFLGTSTIQPALLIDGASRVEGSRAKLTFSHVSALRRLATPAQSFVVRARTYGYQEGTHSLTCSIWVGETAHSAESAVLRPDQDGSTLHTFTFEVGTAGASSYQVHLTGTRPSPEVPPFIVSERVEVAMN
ncbi:MAG: hypothetical protein ACHWZW_03065 [Spirulina sp.]